MIEVVSKWAMQSRLERTITCVSNNQKLDQHGQDLSPSNGSDVLNEIIVPAVGCSQLQNSSFPDRFELIPWLRYKPVPRHDTSSQTFYNGNKEQSRVAMEVVCIVIKKNVVVM